MSILERITYVFDVQTASFKQGVSQLKSEIAQTDGVANKAKVGLKGLGDMAGPYLAMGAAAGATALATFAAKAVKGFEDGALAADKFAQATGMSIEDASRWREVADDMGVSTDTLQSAIGRFTRQLGTGALKQFGIEAQVGADGLTDVNASALQAFTAISNITDATERNKAAQAAFGKSYQELSRIFQAAAGDGAELKAQLDGVADAQVFTSDDANDAKDLQAAMADLQDIVTQVSNNLARNLVPALTDVAEGIKVVSDLDQKFPNFMVRGLDAVSTAAEYTGTKLHDLTDNVGLTHDAVLDFGGALGEAAKRSQNLADNINPATMSAREIADAIKDAGDRAEYYASRVEAAGTATVEAADAMGDYTTAADDAETSTHSLGGQLGDMADEADRATEAWQALHDELSDERILNDVSDGFVDIKQSAADAYDAAASGAEDASDKARQYRDDLLALKENVAQYAEEVLGLPPEQITDILALIDQGKFDEAQLALVGLAMAKPVPLEPAVDPVSKSVAEGIIAALTATRQMFVQVIYQYLNPFSGSGSGGSSFTGGPKGSKGAPTFETPSEAWAWWLSQQNQGGGSNGGSAPKPDDGVVTADDFDASSGKDKFDDIRIKRVKAAVELGRRKYDAGDIWATHYLKLLQWARPFFKRYSDYWSFLDREIKSVKDDIEANKPAKEDGKPGGGSNGGSAPKPDDGVVTADDYDASSAKDDVADIVARRAKARVELARRQYERGGITAFKYRRILRRVMPLFKKDSDYWTYLYSEVRRVNQDIAQQREDAKPEPEPEPDPEPKPEKPTTTAGERARNAQDARHDMWDAISSLYGDNSAETQIRVADAIWRSIQADADRRWFRVNKPQKWGAYAAKRLEQAIALYAGWPVLTGRLETYLKDVRRAMSQSKGDGGSDLQGGGSGDSGKGGGSGGSGGGSGGVSSTQKLHLSINVTPHGPIPDRVMHQIIKGIKRIEDEDG